MITGKLSNGFEFEADEKVIGTYRFSRLVARTVSKDKSTQLDATFSILPTLLGEDGEEALLNYIKEQTGEEPTEKEVSELIIEIMNVIREEDEKIKKSLSSDES